jgi:AcrR family transcriptional regulator
VVEDNDASTPGVPGVSAMPVPASIRAAWGLHERPSRGPKAALRLDRIVEAAITVADAEGLEAVSMSRVAAELGSSAMSLYRYVASKDELLALMLDAAMGLPPAPPADPADWRTGLTQWSVAVVRLYLKAPWTVRIPVPTPPITPNQIRWLEAGLSCMCGTGLLEREKLSTILLLSALARFQGTIAADFAVAAAAADGLDPSAGYGAALRQLADPADFPAVHAAILSGSLDDEGNDFTADEMQFGLERILDGLDTLIRQRLTNRH